MYVSIDVVQHALPWCNYRADDNRYSLFSFHSVFLS